MKHINFFNIANIAKMIILLNILLLIFFSCSQEDLKEDMLPESGLKNSGKVNEELITPEAKTYYTLLKTAILATNSNSVEAKNSGEENPFVDKLKDIKILDENNRTVSFYSLDKNEQVKFLNDWMLIESDGLSNKMKQYPELTTIIQGQNKVLQQVMSEQNVFLTKGESGMQRVRNNSDFFKIVNERLNAKSEDFKQPNSLDEKIGILKSDSVAPIIVKTQLQNYARRGDFLVKLPKQGYPWIYLNVFDRQLLGHSAIINHTVNVNDNIHKLFTISPDEHGVKEEPISYWCVHCYIMGIQKVTWKMKMSVSGIHFYKEVTPVSDLDLLPDFAKQYMGRKYVKWYEFPVAKSVAPTRFTCTTLVWWCTKQVYNIDLSSWWSPVVSPSQLFLSENAYVRAVVKE